jgi:nucleoside-diphosphate-sugar epimerase
MNDLLDGHHVVIGAGPVGTAIAHQLTAAGARVRVVTRSGAVVRGATTVACDASDVDALREQTADAAVIYNAANPPYARWAKAWPPMASAMLTAAEESGAVLATVSNLYCYGEVDGPMTEDMPLNATFTNGRVRAQMWQDARAAHESGRVRVVEVRASDYIGGGAQSVLQGIAGALKAGKRPNILGRADQPHSWTSPADTARTLIAAANDDSALGRPWHVPSPAPRTQQQVANDLATLARLPTPVELRSLPLGAMRALRPLVPIMRALVEVQYQLRAPFVIDDSAARAHFGLEPTPWEDLIRDVAGVSRRVDA